MKQAVQVDIKSIGGAFDNAAYQVVLALVGNIVAQGVVEKFVVHPTGDIEECYRICIKLNQSESADKLETISAQLKAIKPNPRSSYAVKTVESCE